MGLTRKQANFLSEYLTDFNATQAAIRAGYSVKSANPISQKLLKNPEIQAGISQKIAEKAMKSDEILQEIADIARGSMGDFLDISSMAFHVDLNRAKELGKLHLIKKIKQRTTLKQGKDGDEEEFTNIEIELIDKLDALKTLAKAQGLLIDRQEIRSSGPVEIVIRRIDAPKP
ncbi:MAG: terminase small subunit [Smithella sp.]